MFAQMLKQNLARLQARCPLNSQPRDRRERSLIKNLARLQVGGLGLFGSTECVPYELVQKRVRLYAERGYLLHLSD